MNEKRQAEKTKRKEKKKKERKEGKEKKRNLTMSSILNEQRAM